MTKVMNIQLNQSLTSSKSRYKNKQLIEDSSKMKQVCYQKFENESSSNLNENFIQLNKIYSFEQANSEQKNKLCTNPQFDDFLFKFNNSYKKQNKNFSFANQQQQIQNWRINSEELISKFFTSSQKQSIIRIPSNRKKRVSITINMLEEIKIIFSEYNILKYRPLNERFTFQQIAEKLNISKPEVKHLYTEYLSDPSFSKRIKKYNKRHIKKVIMQQDNKLTERRLAFVQQLMIKHKRISEEQILDELKKIDSLHEYNRQKIKIPITISVVRNLIELNYLSLSNHSMSNDIVSIQNRFKYSQIYFNAIQNLYSEFYFLGEFNFSVDERENKFVKIENCFRNQNIKNIGCLAIIGLQGIVYYQIYNKIHLQMNFSNIIQNIGKLLTSKNAHLRKYLVLQTHPIHNKQDLRKIELTYKIKVLLIPPKSSKLNPINFLFQQIKKQLRNKINLQKRKLRSTLIQILEVYKQKSLSNYFLQIKPYVESSLKQNVCE